MKSPKKSYRIIKTSRPLVFSLSRTKPSLNKSSEPEFKTTDSLTMKSKKRKVCKEPEPEILANQKSSNTPAASNQSSSIRPNLNTIVLKCHICEEDFYGHVYLELHLKHWHKGENIEILNERRKERSQQQNRISSTPIMHSDGKKISPTVLAPHELKECQTDTIVQNRKTREINPLTKIVTSTNTKIESLDVTDFENQCPYCIKKFVTSQDLQIHLRSHVNKPNISRTEKDIFSSSLPSNLKSAKLSPSRLEESSSTTKQMISPPKTMSAAQFAFFQKKSGAVS